MRLCENYASNQPTIERIKSAMGTSWPGPTVVCKAKVMSPKSFLHMAREVRTMTLTWLKAMSGPD